MSLITICPACATMFKVVPDQLRVSDGWVRCGQCNEVFDANLNFQANKHALIGRVVDEVTHPPEIAPQEHVPGHADLNAPVSETGDLPDDDENRNNDPFLAVNPHALHFEPEALLEHSAESNRHVEEMRQLNASPQVDAAQVSDSAVEHPFLGSKKTASIGKRRSDRLLLMISCLVLILVLVLQVVNHERDRIAAAVPATKGPLEAVCRVAGCSIAPLRQIEAVVIDSSSFTKVRADVYRLSLALKNTAHIGIATPALELTLTDMQDQPVIRRVIAAVDFGDKSGVMEAGAELFVTVPLHVKLAGKPEKISGYRLLSFYP